MRDFLFSYDDIYLRPKHSSLKSRRLADTSINFCGYNFKLPIVPATMVDVISFSNAKYLSDNGYFYIMHRFDEAVRKFSEYAIKENLKLLSFSIGVNDEAKEDIEFIHESFRNANKTIDFLSIDVAHADHDNVRDMMHWLSEHFDGYVNKPKIIAGNIATADGYKFLCDLGVDAVKCGLGGGSICSTKFKTGFHLPTAYSVYECAQTGLDVPIIADGGAKHFGDVAKALTLGASLLMSGKWFAECLDSPAKIKDGKKIYRGSTSYEAKGHNNHIEGHTIEIVEGCNYEERLKEISDALKSSISYAGGTDLNAFNSVEWHLIK